MDSGDVKASVGTAGYYLKRLIQRAVVEPKPLLKIYEEECNRHPDIGIYVSFKEFQSALQRHCMTLQSRQQATHAKQQEAIRQHKEHSGKFTSLSEFLDEKRKRRRLDLQGLTYQRMQQSILERFSPQGSHMNNRYNGTQQPSASAVNIKTEEHPYTSPPAVLQPTHSVSRPSSVQPPVEEEPPPEFIEMSSNPPRLSSSSQFAGMNVYHSNVSSEQNVSPATIGGPCKSEPKESDSGGTVQSSSPLDKNPVLCTDDISPLNVRCVKCITALVTCAVMPCGHCCLCNICGQTAVSLKQVCPVCRKSISTVIGYSNLIYNVYR